MITVNLIVTNCGYIFNPSLVLHQRELLTAHYRVLEIKCPYQVTLRKQMGYKYPIFLVVSPELQTTHLGS